MSQTDYVMVMGIVVVIGWLTFLVMDLRAHVRNLEQQLRDAQQGNDAETGQTCPNCGGSGVDITLGKAGSCYCVNGTGHV